MQKEISSKIVVLTFGVLAVSFLAAFYVIAWQEPTQPPPEGNVPSPINVGPAHQTKEGNLTIGIADIKGDGSISTNLNADKLDDYHAADLLAAVGGGPYYGWVVEQYSWSGLWPGGCQWSGCESGGAGYCDADAKDMGCEGGYDLVRVFVTGSAQGICSTILYVCYDSPPPGCGDGIVQEGEACDDGNNLNNTGDCLSDCSKINKFSALVIKDSTWGHIYYDVASTDQFCKEKGFNNTVRYVTYLGLRGTSWANFCGQGGAEWWWHKWDGTQWYTQNCALGEYRTYKIWCEY